MAEPGGPECSRHRGADKLITLYPAVLLTVGGKLSAGQAPGPLALEPVMLYLFNGLRLSEVLGIQWQGIDFSWEPYKSSIPRHIRRWAADRPPW